METESRRTSAVIGFDTNLKRQVAAARERPAGARDRERPEPAGARERVNERPRSLRERSLPHTHV